MTTYPTQPTGDNSVDLTNIFASNSTNKIIMSTSEILEGYNNDGEAATPLTSTPDGNKFNYFWYQVHNTLVWVVNYAKALFDNKLELSGGIMTGALSLGSNKATSSYVPLADADLANKLYVDTAMSGAMWLSEVKYLAYTTIPTLPSGVEVVNADGRALSRSTYSTLFSLLGVTYGSGDGSTTFNIPDLRGKYNVGWNGSSALDAGRLFGSDQKRELSKFIIKYNMSAGVGVSSGTATQSGLLTSYSNTYQYPTYITIDGVTVEGVWGANDGVPVAKVSAEVKKGQSYSAVGQSTVFYPEVETTQNSSFTQTNIALYPVMRIK